MCTTLLLLGTLVMMLRRRFFNKVEPYVLSCPLGAPGLGTRGRGVALGWRISLLSLRSILGDIWFPSGFDPLGASRSHSLVQGRGELSVLSPLPRCTRVSKEDMQE